MKRVSRELVAQAEHCAANGAPITASVVRAQLSLLEASQTRCGRRLASWQGSAIDDALGLRLAAGLHDLHLSNTEPRLASLYDHSFQEEDEARVSELILSVVADHDEALLPWFDSPPQTTEAGRSAGVMAALIWLANERKTHLFELREIGASAGVNTNMSHYRYQLGNIAAGNPDSKLLIVPEWRGQQLCNSAEKIQISNSLGCDQNPLDLTNVDTLDRLKAYVWADSPNRMKTLEFAALIARSNPPLVEKMDAADFAEREFSNVPKGVTRILFHTIVWQYLPESTRNRILSVLRQSAERGDSVAIVAIETNRTTFRHEISVRHWANGKEQINQLGIAQAHGKWIDWNPEGTK